MRNVDRDGAQSEVLYVYGTDGGDVMNYAWFADPGEEAHWCEASDDHLVYPAMSWDALPDGPYTVLYQDGKQLVDWPNVITDDTDWGTEQVRALGRRVAAHRGRRGC